MPGLKAEHHHQNQACQNTADKSSCLPLLSPPLLKLPPAPYRLGLNKEYSQHVPTLLEQTQGSHLSGSSSSMKFSTDTAGCFSWMTPVRRRLSILSWAPWVPTQAVRHNSEPQLSAVLADQSQKNSSTHFSKWLNKKRTQNPKLVKGQESQTVTKPVMKLIKYF